MLQPFDNPDTDSFKPLPLNNFARETRKQQTNFLTFNKQQPSYQAVEFARGASANGGGTDWSAELDDTFAKRGVWDFRYDDVANPVAAGVDYNRDMGGPDIFKIKPESARPGTSIAEQMGGASRASSTQDSPLGGGGKLLGRVPVRRENETGGRMAQYVKDTVGQDKKFDNVKPAAYKTKNAYETYGYKEYGIDRSAADEDAAAALAMFLRKPKTENETAVLVRDVEYCPEGHTWVDGHCIPTNHPEGDAGSPICPFGWHMNAEGRCQLDKNKEMMEGSSSSHPAHSIGNNNNNGGGGGLSRRVHRDANGVLRLAQSEVNDAKSDVASLLRKAKQGLDQEGRAISARVRNEGSVMADDLHRAVHKESMTAGGGPDSWNVVAKDASSSSEQPGYRFSYESWSSTGSVLGFVGLLFLIILVVIAIRYAYRSPMRRQIEIERAHAAEQHRA